MITCTGKTELGGGEGGIRTHGTVKPYTGFRIRRIRPLCHLSAASVEFSKATAQMRSQAEVDMKTSKQARYISLSVAAFAASVGMSAHAEYRCDGQPLPEEKRACELVKQGPDALRQFIDRTRGIYGLYFYDYVSEADTSRWHAAPQSAQAAPKLATDDRRKLTAR
jgi:hypothetical protein